MSTEPQYEFDKGQSSLIRDLSRKMQAVGAVWRLVGLVFLALAGVIGYLGYRRAGNSFDFTPEIWAGITGHAFVGLFNLLIGGWTVSAARNFHRVATTTGSDISHLMNALRSLHEMFALIYMLIWLAILMGLVSLGFGAYSLMQPGGA